VSLKNELTSADLEEIRQSALGAADPLGIAADLAAAVPAGRLADPEDAGLALTLAAGIAESRNKIDAALRYADSALEAYGKRDDAPAANARALRARILFRAGREDEAMAEIEPLRAGLTQHADLAAAVSVALAVGGRHRLAEQWLSEAVQEALAERGTAAEPASAEDAGLLFFLLQQRHRLRHAIGLQHDAHDNLAERLETRLANASPAGGSAAGGDLVFWPQAEFTKLVEKWPALTGTYGADWDAHRARLERELVRLAGTGRGDLAVFPASVSGLTSFAGIESDPTAEATLTGYAARLASAAASGSGSTKISWPVERNGPCWCGSGNKYKKCCLPRSRS
jgi:hypothetical protein